MFGSLIEGLHFDIVNFNVLSFSGYKVGFTATGGSLTSSHIVKFQTVNSNYGSGYSPKTGFFTCSHAGYYFFSVSLIKDSSSDGIWCDLLKNSVSSASLYNNPKGDGTDEGAYETSGFAFVHLNHGDTIHIKCDKKLFHFGPFTLYTVIINPKSSFSGFMLTSD